MKSPRKLLARLLGFRALRAILLASLACAFPAGVRADGSPGKPESLALLDRFRRSVWSEPVYLEFDLRQMPRRGDERVYHGRLWGARNDGGPVTRLEVDVGKGGFTHRVLMQSGPDGGIWISDGKGEGTRADDAALRPLVPGLEITPFDIQMPYLYWLDVQAAGVERIRGRPSNVYVFTPSADFTAASPGIASVRAYLDTQYDALVQSEVTATGGNLAKTLSLLELRKVGDRWILKDVDVRNEATRDKTRLSVTAVAAAIPVDPSAFTPSMLGAELAPPPRDAVKRVSQ